jgi:hypothetical protein
MFLAFWKTRSLLAVYICRQSTHVPIINFHPLVASHMEAIQTASFWTFHHFTYIQSVFALHSSWNSAYLSIFVSLTSYLIFFFNRCHQNAKKSVNMSSAVSLLSFAYKTFGVVMTMTTYQCNTYSSQADAFQLCAYLSWMSVFLSTKNFG